jgi:Fur family iron response transcriptional regulator
MNEKMTERQKEVIAQLQDQGLRMTRQREGLVQLLWADENNQHITVEKLFSLANQRGLGLSLSTVYNTLNQWADRGLLLRIQPSKVGAPIYFDTNTTHHHHFFDEDKNSLIDITQEAISVQEMPELPKGKKINEVDVFIRISKNPLA